MIPPSPRPDSDAGLPAARCGSRRACLAGGSATAYLVLALMMAPSLVWVLLDRRVWTSDEGLYGLWVLELHNALWYGPTGWWEAMMAIAPKAPLLPWIAQLFVPVGVLVGHIDAGLQIVTVLASSAAVVLMYATLKSIFGRRSTALIGALALASAPVFLTLSRTFYAQPLQLTAVTWLIYIMARARHWDNTFIVLQLAAAGVFAVLTQLSSPAFCVLPVMAAGLQVLKSRKNRWRFGRAHAVLLGMVLVLVFGGVSWFLRNGDAAVAYAGLSFGYVFGGASQVFLEKLLIWADLVQRGAFLWPGGGLLLGLLVVWAFWHSGRRGDANQTDHRVLIALVLAQITLVVVLFASSSHQTYRYGLPLMPYIAFVLAWSVNAVGRTWVPPVVTAVLVGQFVLSNVMHFGMVERVADSRSLQSAPGRHSELLDVVLDVTADAGDRTVFVGLGGLDLFSTTLRFYSMQRAGGATLPNYESVEFNLTGLDQNRTAPGIDAVWTGMLESDPAYVVVASASVRRAALAQSADHGWSEIVRNTDVIAQRVATSGRFTKVPQPAYPEIEVYRSGKT